MFDVLLGASGGIFGILGALFKQGLETWQEKKKAEAALAVLVENNRHEAAMADKRMDEIRLEAEHATVLAEIGRVKETDVAAYGALTESYDNDKATYSNAPTSQWMVMVDAVRGLIRPVLTTVFSIALIGSTWWLLSVVPDETIQNPEFLNATLYRMIDALLFLATSAVGWWFGSRMSGGTSSSKG